MWFPPFTITLSWLPTLGLWIGVWLVVACFLALILGQFIQAGKGPVRQGRKDF